MREGGPQVNTLTDEMIAEAMARAEAHPTRGIYRVAWTGATYPLSISGLISAVWGGTVESEAAPGPQRKAP